MANKQALTFREILQELKSFMMRDLQDYRLSDYQRLSRVSRRILLSCVMPVAILFIFMIWRYFWGASLITQYDFPIKQLTQQLSAIEQQIVEDQRFLEWDIIQNKPYLQKNFQKLSESTLIEIVKNSLKEHDLELIQLLPQKSMMAIADSHRNSRLKKHFNRIENEGLISKLMTLSKEESWQYLQLEKPALFAEKMVIPRFEINLALCGTHLQVLLFLADLYAQLQDKKTLFYLEVLNFEEEASCSAIKGELVFHFYDLPTLQKIHQNLVDQKEVEQPPNPFLLAERYFSLSKDGQRGFLETQDFQVQMEALFQDTLERNSLASRSLTKKDSFVSSYYWHVGEVYEGLLLAGIIFQESGSFAIVKDQRNVWKRLQVGEFNIVEIAATYLVIVANEV